MSKSLGFVVNPKSGHLLMAVRIASADKPGSDDVSVMSVDSREVGRGFVSSFSDEASDATGLPRAHVPRGVIDIGSGYGTPLYCALALQAHLQFTGLDDSSGHESIGDGISSYTTNESRTTSERSVEASKWWSNALNYYGLSSRRVSMDGKIFDSMKYEAAAARGIVALEAAVAPASPGKMVGSFLRSFKMPEAGSYATLVAVNWGAMKAREEEGTMDILDACMTMARSAGASKRDLDGMMMRFRKGADVRPKREVRSAVSVDDAMKELDILDRRRRSLARAGRSRKQKVANPHRVEPVFYGHTRSNPGNDPALMSELSRVAELRRELGWDRF